MRSRWEALHAGLAQSIHSREAVVGFQELRVRSEALRRFPEPGALVDYLAHNGGDLDEKDRILGALVESVHERIAGRLAEVLALLGLWPGLDAVFNRRLNLFREQPQDLSAELVHRFAIQVRRLDLSHVVRVAATLVRNTERQVVEARVREIAIAARSSNTSAEGAELSPAVAGGSPGVAEESPMSLIGLPTGRTNGESIAILRCWLKEAIGRDADLVLEAVVYDRKGPEHARTFVISPAAARKRLERALERVRKQIAKKGCHTSRGGSAFGGHDYQT